MKNCILTAIWLTAFLAGTTFAVVIVPFPGWDALIAKSPEIVIAKCLKAPEETLARKDGVVEIVRDGVFPSEIEVAAVLKGGTNRGPVRVYSQVPLRRGEDYLIFAHYFDEYSATEPYRVVSLGSHFSTNLLAGKQLDDQIQTLLQFRLKNLNSEMERLQEERVRVESGLKK